jgi:rhamnulokinase
MSVTVAAVDLGAASGRVMLARIGEDRLELTESQRFANRPVELLGTLHWDILALYRGVVDGLRIARQGGAVDGIGVDSWAVDFGLLDADGELVANPVCYRDQRTNGVMERVLADLGNERVYATTGVQNLPFNTIYQLVAARTGPAFSVARTMLLIPDLLSYWLTGSTGAELTNASTTQLLDVGTGDWSADLLGRIGLPREMFPPIRQPGDRVGLLRPDVAVETGLGPIPVFAVGSHDTASAVVGVPAGSEPFAYISCGTWSLVGVELDAPVLTEASRRANFTNELGVDGTVRYLRNVMGLWLLQESVRTWETRGGRPVDLEDLLHAAAQEPPRRAVVNPDDPVFLTPGDMPDRIARVCAESGQPRPASPAGIARCIMDSLAVAHRRAVRQAAELSRRDVEILHVVGGGARNALLCQLTADACGLPVVAGPVEATALGNALVQARALGAVSGDLTRLRRLIRSNVELRYFEPHGKPTDWDQAEAQAYEVPRA